MLEILLLVLALILALTGRTIRAIIITAVVMGEIAVKAYLKRKDESDDDT